MQQAAVRHATSGPPGLAPYDFTMKNHHEGKNNWLFADYHVEPIAVQNTWGKGNENDCRGIWTLDPDD